MTYAPPINPEVYENFTKRLNPAIRKFKGARGDFLIAFPEYEPELLNRLVAKYKKHKSGFYSAFRMTVINNDIYHN